MKAHSSAFPTEIYERIVLYASIIVPAPVEPDWYPHQISCETAPVLCACALTCRAWLSISRICLYRKLTITSATKQDTLSRLIATLDADHAFRDLVVELEVVQWHVSDHSHIGWYSWPALLAGKLPQLRILCFNSYADLSVPRLCRTLFRAFGNVAELTLRWDGPLRFSEVARYLAAFPRLSRLSLRGRSLAHPKPSELYPDPYQVRLLPKVRYLSSDYCRGCGHSLQNPLTRETFNAFAATVEVIDWAGYAWPSDLDPEPAPQLWFRKLRIICLYLEPWSRSKSEERLLSYLSAWLRSVKTSCLKHVVLCLAVPPDARAVDNLLPELGDVSKVDDALHNHHPSVASLSICFMLPLFPVETDSRLLEKASGVQATYRALLPPLTTYLEDRLPLHTQYRELRVYMWELRNGVADGWLQAMPDGQIRESCIRPAVVAELDL
ncbi:hypothetical protein BV20DRAFT_967210 [Pilatotrama ljubarskyi]|nr:hypothetical protein BV20DRAFT_967210 [Pilatotrama ljubarskyi]